MDGDVAAARPGGGGDAVNGEVASATLKDVKLRTCAFRFGAGVEGHSGDEAAETERVKAALLVCEEGPALTVLSLRE